ncbi:MAG: HEAT repeat domain-containing protein [Pseudomonadota bacterium]
MIRPPKGRGSGHDCVRRTAARAPWLLVVIMAGVWWPGASCRRQATPRPAAPLPRLEAVEIDDAAGDGAGAGPLNVDAIAGGVRKMLIDSHVVATPNAGDAAAVAGASGGAALRVAGRAGFESTEVGAKGITRAAVSIRLSTRPADAPGAINEDLSAAGERPYDVRPDTDRRRLGQELVERIATDLLGGLLARIRLATATPAEIHAAITADGGPLRDDAIRIAGTRGLRDEVPTLLALLQNDDESVRDAALGALITLREPRAVTELTRNRSLRDRHEMRKILEAISIIGGEEAANYLSFVADSHDDEEIRKLAADAKARLDRHAAPPGK